MKQLISNLATFSIMPLTYLREKTLYCLLFITLLTSSICLSQNSIEYYDQYWNLTKKENAIYTRLGTKNEKGIWEGKIVDLYINGKLQSEGNYKNGRREGTFIFYYSDESLKYKGEYKKNNPIGKWQSWYKNGQLKEDYFYTEIVDDKNVISPDDRIRHVNFYDSTGIQLAKEGNGEYYSFKDDNTVEAKGQIKTFRKEGEWVGYNKDNTLYFKEQYKEGMLVSGTSWDKKGKSYTYKRIKEMPEFPGGQNNLFKHIASTVRYPVDAARAGVDGIVYLSITIDENGSISDIKVSKGIGYGCDEEAVRTYKRSPDWNPGTERGQNVKMTVLGLVRFKLSQ